MILRRIIVCIAASISLSALHTPRIAHADATPNDAATLSAYYSGNGLLQRGLFDLAEREYRAFLTAHPNHEKAPVARYGLAVCLVRQELHEAALKELLAIPAGKDFPYEAEVLVMLGQSHLALGQFEPAIKALNRMLKAYAGHKLAADALVQLTEAEYRAGRFEAAVTSADSIMNQFPDSPHQIRARFFRGLALMSLERFDAARVDLAAVLKAEPEGPLSAQATMLSARCAHRAGDLEAAQSLYRRTISAGDGPDRQDAMFGLAILQIQKLEYSKAAASLDDYLAAFPKGAQAAVAMMHRGRVAMDLGELDTALAQLKSAMKAGAPPDEAAYWLARCHARMNDHAEAAEILTATLKANPDSTLAPEMRYDLAAALYRAEDLPAAERALSRFARLHDAHPLLVEALHLLATIQHQRKNYDDSLKSCQSFLSRFGDHRIAGAVTFLAAENLFLSGDDESAAKEYEDFLHAHPDHSEAPKAAYRLGMARYRQGRLDEAAKKLEPICRSSPIDPAFRQALVAMGNIAFTRGEWKNAEGYLSAYLSDNASTPAAGDARLKLGLARQRQQRHEEALAALDELLNGSPGDPIALHAMFERGQCLVALSRGEQAREAFQAVLDAEPDGRFAPHALNHLGALALARGDAEAAATYYGRIQNSPDDTALSARAMLAHANALLAARDFDAALTAFTKFIKAHAGHEQAREAMARRAICLARLDRHADALTAIGKVNLEQLDGDLRSALRYEQAWCLKALGNRDDAIAAYRALISETGGAQPNLPAMLELAALEMEAGRRDEAATLLGRVRQAATSAGDQAALLQQATYRLAVCEFERGRSADAVKLFEAFIEAAPDGELLTSARALCGEALFKLGRHAAAAKHLSAVIEGDAKSHLCAPAMLRLGECHAAMQRWAAGEEVFRAYLRQFGESEAWHQAAFGLAWAIENQGRHDEAIEEYRRIVDRHKGPTTARAQFQIGECLFAKKQYEEAARELLKVDILYAYPEWSAAALYEAGRCFEKLSRLVEARQQFRQVAEKYADTNWAKLASERLSEMSVAGMPGH